MPTDRVRVNREEFLTRLQSVQAGLSTKEMVAQSSCFIFKRGRVITFNDEVACWGDSGLPDDFEVAVQAKKILAILELLEEEELEIRFTGKEMRIKGKGLTGIPLESKISLAVAMVEEPKDWKPLHKDFNHALEVVQYCTGKDENKWQLTCVHVTPKWLEAFDNRQMSRYWLPTDFEQECLIRRKAVIGIAPLGMTEFSETKNWIHFRNPAKLSVACRRESDCSKFPDLKKIYDVKGEKMMLPKGLPAMLKKAGLFSMENTASNFVTVRIDREGLLVIGEGDYGWHEDPAEITYTGDPRTFMIDPMLLAEISKNHNECEVTHNRLLVDKGNFIYVTGLGIPKEERNGDGKSGSEG